MSSLFQLSKKSLLFIAVAVVGLSNASEVAAQAQTPPALTVRPVVGFSSMGQALNTMISIAMFVGALLAFGYLIWGAFKWVTARDNSSETAAARQTMLNAVIGLFLLGMIFVIFSVVVKIIPGLNQFFVPR